jgi:hypothetical protein
MYIYSEKILGYVDVIVLPVLCHKWILGGVRT